MNIFYTKAIKQILIRFGIFVVFLILLPVLSYAQKSLDSLDFATNGTINTSIITGNSLFIGGTFDNIGKKIGPVAFFNKGSILPDQKKPLIGYITGSFNSDQVYAVVSDGNGGWYVGGDFSLVMNRNSEPFVHFLADNTLDSELKITWKSIRKINILRKDGNNLYVGGEFIAIDKSGKEHKNVFRMDINTNAIDVNWNPPIVNSSKIENIVISNDKVFMTGWLGKVGTMQQDAMVVVDKNKGTPVTFPTTSGCSAMFLLGDTLIMAEPSMYWSKKPDGSGYISELAAVLTPQQDYPSWSAPYGFFYSSIGDGNDGWYVAGDYLDKHGVFHLDKDLNEISSFKQSQIKSFSGKGSAMALSGNSLFVSSVHSGWNSVTLESGKKMMYLFKLDATTGAIDTTFSPNPTRDVNTLYIHGDTLFVGGTFDSIAGEQRRGFAAFSISSGALLPWNPVLEKYDCTVDYNCASVRDIKIIGDKIYLGGNFYISTPNFPDNYRGIYGLARFDLSSGSIDTTFHPFTSYSLASHVTSLAYNNGKLYLTGKIEKTVSGKKEIIVAGKIELNKDFNNLLKVNNDLNFSWSSSWIYPSVLYKNNILYFRGVGVKNDSTGEKRDKFVSLNEPDGSLTTWNPNPNDDVYSFSFSKDKMLFSGYFYFFKSQPNDLWGININTKKYIKFPNLYTVYSIVANSEYIFMGGDFTRYNDSIVNGLLRLKRSDLSLTKFDHQIKNDNSTAYIGDLALGANGLYAVGHYSNMFNLVAGVKRQNICLLDPANGSLKEWNPPPSNGRIFRVFTSGSDVVLSGEFGLMPSWSRFKLAKIDLASGNISSWDANINDNSWWSGTLVVNTLLISGDTLYVGGNNILKIGNKEVTNCFAVNALNGSRITDFSPKAVKGEVSHLYKVGNSLFLGGNFSKIGDTLRFKVAQLNGKTGTLSSWNAKLDPSNPWSSLSGIFANDTSVFLLGSELNITGKSDKSSVLRLKKSDASLVKLYKNTEPFYSAAVNTSGIIIFGGRNGSYKGLYKYDKTLDSIVPTIKNIPEFRYGINKIKSVGDKFLVSGNYMIEKGTITDKPGLYVYDPANDTVISSFSTPVVDGTIKSFAANEKYLVFTGDFAGMNGSLQNADMSTMQTPDLFLKPGVTSWSPHSANNADPYAVAIYGSGFNNETTVSLDLSSKTQKPDSLVISNRKILAFFNGVNFTVGKWDLNVKVDKSASPIVFKEAMSIKKAEKAKVWVTWTGPNRVLAGKPTTYYVTYGNKGNKDAYGVILYVAVGPNQTVMFPSGITHPKVKFNVNWDTIPNYVDVDYFLGEPFHGKVYTMFIPYMPQQFNGGMKLRVTSDGGYHEVRVAISQPIYQNYTELLTQNLKSSDGIGYNFFSCMYAVAGIVADLTPGLSCAKAAFDNSVLMAIDKYQKNESIKIEDIANSVGLTAIGCVPGESQLKLGYKIAKGMASMYSGVSDAGGAISACGGFASDCAKEFQNMTAFVSHDPNAKFGPSGRASSVYIPTKDDYQYMITYENDSTATAPAQRVIITDTLDKNVLDILTFKPVGFGFGDTTYFYKKTDGDTIDIDMRPKKQIIVRVIYKLEQTSGILTWTFLTLDPNTYQLVENVDAGFLPPNKKSPQGEGNVVYTISPLSGLADGTIINNSAHIVFDWNNSIPTNRWHNTADNSTPRSAVEPLPAVTMNKNFNVHWKGSDKESGIFSYTIFVSENDSAYYPWLLDTHDTAAVFSGKGGVTYKFYSVAVDSAGNQEQAPVMYEAMTRVSGTGIDNFGEGNKMQFRIFPNPARNQVNVNFYLPESSSIRIDLLNVCGHLVMEPQKTNGSRGNSNLRLNVAKLPSGYYFVRILTKYGVQTRKLFINK